VKCGEEEKFKSGECKIEKEKKFVFAKVTEGLCLK